MRETRGGWGETSLRSKRFRLVSKQRNTEGRGLSVLTAREMKREPKSERGGKGRGRIVRIHWDFTMNAVHAFQTTKKNYLVSQTGPLKFISAPLKAKHFIGQLWQLMTASNVGARTQAWQANASGWFSKSRDLSASVSFLSSPPPPALLLMPFFARSLTLVPRCFLLNRTETLATQVRERQGERHDIESMP